MANEEKVEKEVVGSVVVQYPISNFSPDEIAKFLNDFAIDELIKKRFLNSFMDGFAQVEATETRVSDIVMKAEDFSILRKYGGEVLDLESSKDSLMKGFFGMMLGACVWVRKDADGVKCFGEGSKELEKLYPDVIKAKLALDLIV